MQPQYKHKETFEMHYGLVGMAANSTCKFMPREDRMQAGSIGLMQALKEFDATRKVKFCSFASRAIQRAIQRESAHYQIGLAVPAATNEVIKLVKRFQFVRNKTPTGAEVKQLTTRSFLPNTLQKIITLFCEGPPAYSLDWQAPAEGGSDGYSKIHHQYLGDKRQEGIYNRKVNQYVVHKAVFSCLTARQRHIVARFYGLDARGAVRSRIIAGELGISSQAVIQNKDRALGKLRNYFGLYS